MKISDTASIFCQNTIVVILTYFVKNVNNPAIHFFLQSIVNLKVAFSGIFVV